jgi:hypothetical protein
MSVQNSFCQVASADLLGGRAVFVNSSNELAYAVGPLTASVGILAADINDGEAQSVITGGPFYCACSGTIDAGTFVVPGASGQLVAASANTTRWFVVGQAVADSSGGLVYVNVAPFIAASGSLA